MGKRSRRRVLVFALSVILAGVAGVALAGAAGATTGDVATAATPAGQTADAAPTGQATDTESAVQMADSTQSLRSEHTADGESNLTEVVDKILEEIPDPVLDELPDGFVDDVTGAIDDDVEIPPGLVDQAVGAIGDIPDSILEQVLTNMLDNVPDEVLNDSGELVEDPPDEIPAILCRASDMADKHNRNGKEMWGPTDVNAQIGNQNLTVATNELGTVTVFKYPNPSFASQVKHHAFDRREPYYGADPNSGTFLGLTYTTESGDVEFDWLRDWGPVSTTDPDHAEHVDQEWQSDISDTLVTEYSNETLGLNVTVVDAVPVDQDVHIRDIAVEADADSPVTDVEVVSYANFNLVEDKDAIVPTRDWCAEAKNDANVSYDPGADALVYETAEHEPDLPPEMLERAGPEFSVATAMAFDGESSQHHVAGDDFIGNDSSDPYRLLSEGTVELPGNDSYTGQASTVLTRDIAFENGQGEARVYFGAASADEPGLDLGENATAKVEATRERSLDTITEEKEEWFAQYVADAPMPDGAPENVTQLSKRALVSIVQAWDPHTENEFGHSGNIVASVATQAPYGADWIRDGAYFNYVLDRYVGENGSGQHDWVTQHNRWYKSLQQNPGGECPDHCNDNMQYYDLGLGVVPEGNLIRTLAADEIPFISAVHEGGWAMNYYADGIPAGPLGGEIDETAYGAWTFWDHYATTGNESYLAEIYPAIELVGDRLTEDCVNETTGLQCPRPEDDNVEYRQTAVGGASAYAGLDAAARAAGEMYRMTGEQEYAEEALAYAQRRDELRQAMDEYYWQEDLGTYGVGRVAMPAFVRPLDDPRMQRQLQHMWENVNRTFSGERDAGQYEAKSLIGLGVAAHELEEPPVTFDQLQRGVEWIADHHARAESTHVMGEAWIRETYAGGEVDSAVSQPHIWEQALAYMSALLAYGNESIPEDDRVGYDAYAEWRNHDPSVASLDVTGGTVDEPVEATVTVENDAPVEQAYHLTYGLEGPDGTRYEGAATDVGPIPAGGSETITLSWTGEDIPEGAYDATVSAWKAAATGPDGEPDAEAVAADPTALTSPEYRQVELDAATAAVTLAQPAPAAFELDALDPAETSLDVDETVDVSAEVLNGGDRSGTAAVELRLDGETVADREVTLDGGSAETVTFEGIAVADLEPGEYEHAVVVVADGVADELTGSLTVTDDSTGDDSTGDDSTGDDATGDDSTGDDSTGDDATGDDATGDDNGTDDGSADDGGPGFGIAVAAFALLAAGLLALRRQES